MPCSLDELIESSKCLNLLGGNDKLAAKVYYMFQHAKFCTALGITTLDELAVSAACLQTDTVTGASIDAFLEYQGGLDAGAAVNGPDNLVTTFNGDDTTHVLLEWTNTSPDYTSILIERSTDGTTWTTVTSVAGNVETYTDTFNWASTAVYYRVSGIQDGISVDAIGQSIACLKLQPPGVLLAMERWLRCQLLNCIE